MPILQIILEKGTPDCLYFEVPHWTGGFNVTWEYSEDRSQVIALNSRSCVRTWGGSGQIHKITSTGYETLEEGLLWT